MINTIKILSPKQIKLNWHGESITLKKVKYIKNLKVFYKFNNEYYA